MRRIAFIWAPRWPTDRLRHGRSTNPSAPSAPPEGAPFALTERASGGFRLAAVDAAAAAAGHYPGQLLADARALNPALICLEHDPAGDAAALRRLARWCGRWSPLVAPLAANGLGRPDALALDVTGVAHLFGGEEALLADMARSMRRLGLEARIALADTIGQAAALARFDPRAASEAGALAAPRAGLAALAELPVAALRLAPRQEENLRAVGLKRVADVARLPRASLARRFGKTLIARMDAAAGRLAEPADPLLEKPPIAARARFAEPLLDLDPLTRAAARLAKTLSAKLDEAGLGARRLRLVLYRVDGEVAQLAAGASRPERDPARLARLLRERLERAAGGLDLGFGVDAAALVAVRTEPPRAAPVSLDPDLARAALADEAAAELADRLAARLGPRAVTRASAVASHIPERAERRVPYEAKPEPFPPGLERPLFLLDPPEPIETLAEAPDAPPRSFRWRRVLHRVARADGPERIAAEWWRRDAFTRDYYRVETVEGRRFWLFRAGLYGREATSDQPPRWYAHGAWG